MTQNNKVNVRRLVGAILLTIFAIGTMAYSQSLFRIAWVGIIRQFQQFLYFYSAWSIGLAIWYFVTIKSQPVKKAELIVKIIFYIVVGLNAVYAAMLDFSNATALGVTLMIIYSIACPWGKFGYKTHPYKSTQQANNSAEPSNSSQQIVKTNWYQNWQNWVIIVLSIIVVSGGFYIITDGSMRKPISNNATASSRSNDQTLTLNYKKYKVKAMKTYAVNYIDNSWDGGDVKINKVIIYKTSKPYKYKSANDGSFTINGFVRIYMSIKSKNDISVYPTQGTLNYSNGEQHGVDSMENWDGNINSGVTKSGTVTAPIEDLPTTSSLKNIRMKFDGYGQNDDSDLLDKDFDFTINLK